MLELRDDPRGYLVRTLSQWIGTGIDGMLRAFRWDAAKTEMLIPHSFDDFCEELEDILTIPEYIPRDEFRCMETDILKSLYTASLLAADRDKRVRSIYTDILRERIDGILADYETSFLKAGISSLGGEYEQMPSVLQEYYDKNMSWKNFTSNYASLIGDFGKYGQVDVERFKPVYKQVVTLRDTIRKHVSRPTLETHSRSPVVVSVNEEISRPIALQTFINDYSRDELGEYIRRIHSEHGSLDTALLHIIRGSDHDLSENDSFLTDITKQYFPANSTFLVPRELLASKKKLYNAPYYPYFTITNGKLG